MAQHLPIQAKYHRQLKQLTRRQRTTASPPGSAHTLPGETIPDRLRYSLTARRQRPPRPTVFSSPPGGPHRAARRHPIQGSLTLRLSPGGDQQAARRHIRGILQLIFGTPFWLILQPKLLEEQLTFWSQHLILIYCQFPSYYNVVIAQPHPSHISTRDLFILKSCHQVLIHKLTDPIPLSPFFTIILPHKPHILN